jgi:hypothetical protein
MPAVRLMPTSESADLMELNGRSSPPMLARYGGSAGSARARCTCDRIVTEDR